jgi:ABC-type uncharacterized transport system ATPase subunit
VFGQRSQLWQALPVRDSFDLLARIYALGDDAHAKRPAQLARLFSVEDLLAREEGTTVLLTSHDSGDIERIAERW